MAQHSNFVSNERAAVVAFLEAVELGRKWKQQWDKLGYTAVGIADGLTGTNSDLAGADVAAFITSMDAIDQFCITNNHYTNLEKARS